MEFIFGSTYITDDGSISKKLMEMRINSVTISGTKYNFQGTLEGGFVNNSKVLMRIQEYNEMQGERNKLDMEVQRLNQELRDLA